MASIKVVKRHPGTPMEDFDINKIYAAVDAAFESFDQKTPKKVKNCLIKVFGSLEGDTIGVEEIQDKVEDILWSCGHKVISKAYSIYRYQRQEERELEGRLAYMEEYKNSSENAASSSETDANANVAIKNVANLEGEVYKVINRRINRRRQQKYLKKLYPTENLHKQYIRDIEHHIIYPHDEASTPVPKNYCEAVSMYPMVQEGVGNMDGITPKPPKWLRSFCGQFDNLAFLLSAQCKGAVAFGELFNYLDYYCVKEFGPSYPLKEELMATSEHVLHRQTIGQQLEEAFQMIVYYLNQPAGNRSYQSPFTNISYYDSNYWHALFDEFRMPDGSKPEWWRVSYLQKKFMKWFNKEREQAMLTFPVNISAA